MKEIINSDTLGKSSLVEILKSFSKSEFREFEKFVNSPFHNNRNDVIQFFNVIKKYYPGFDGPDFNSVRIFRELFKKRKYEDSLLRLLKTHLKKLAFEFISYQMYSENKLDSVLHMIEYFYRKNNFKQMESLIRKYEKEFEDPSELLPEKFYYRWNYCVKKNNLYMNQGKRYLVVENDREISKNMVYFFLSEYFPNLSTVYLYSNDFNVEKEKNLAHFFSKNINIENIMSELGKADSLDARLVEANYYALKAIEDPGDKNTILKLRDLILQYSAKFDRRISKNLYSILQSSYSIKKNKIPEDFKEEFELTKDQVSKDLLSQIEGGRIDPVTIVNTVLTACDVKEFNWARKFLNDYIERAVPESKEEIFMFCRGIMEFHMKNYAKSLEYLVNLNIDIYRYGIKGLICRIYYLLGYTEQVYSFIDSFKHFLKSDRSMDMKKKELNNRFLTSLKKLTAIRDTKDLHGALKLKEYVQSNDMLYSLWLINQIDIVINTSEIN